MTLKRIGYLCYYFKTLDMKKFLKFFCYARKQSGKSAILMLGDILVCSLKYNISLLEYFQFKFYELDGLNRKTFAGTGCMYEYQLIMNPKSTRGILEDKVKFYENYNLFFKHCVVRIEILKKDNEKLRKLINNSAGKLVLKYSKGQCGLQVRILDTEYFIDNNLVDYMEMEGFDLAEEYIVQHPALMDLSPSGVNTIRIITQLTQENEVIFLGARLRVTVNSPVDNMASGNFAAALDLETGVVMGPGFYSDITQKAVEVHPITGVPVVGFRVPYWSEILGMTKEAALQHPENRSIGWDVAVTENGPELIEGNHDWCKLVWQLPVQKGLKNMLEEQLVKWKPQMRLVLS